MTRIFIDDERLPPHDDDYDWVVFRNMNTFLDYLDKLKEETDFLPGCISFDHDMGEDQPTGFDIAKRLVELDMDGIMLFPPNFKWAVHSENPPGKENINGLLESYMSFKSQYYGEAD